MSRVDLVVLGFLSNQPMHGYEIIRFFERRGIELWTRVKTPSVYKALQRMEKKGFIKGEFKQKGNNPPRKVYTITESGREYFLSILRAFLWGDDKFQTPFDFWNALRFIRNNISRDEFLQVLENHRKRHEEMNRMMEEKRKQAEECGKLNDLPFYAKILHKTMQKMKEIELESISELSKAAQLKENQKDFCKETE